MAEQLRITPSGEILYGYKFLEQLSPRILNDENSLAEELSYVSYHVANLEAKNRIVDRDTLVDKYSELTGEKISPVALYIYQSMRDTMKINPGISDLNSIQVILEGKQCRTQAKQLVQEIKKSIPEVEGHEHTLQFALMMAEK